MNLSPRQKAFFLITLKNRPKSAESIFSFLPKGEKEDMVKMYQELSDRKESPVRRVANSELARLSRPKNFSFLAEVHDDWVADLLLSESPEMTATILRYLPVERVKAILQSFPQELLSDMPKLSNVYSIPKHLVELLRIRFENFFMLHRMHDSDEQYEFEQICLLQAKKINQIFLELGYREIAIGLVSLPQDACHVVMERLSVKDRGHVQGYIKSAEKLSPQRLKKAQIHLVGKEVGMNPWVPYIKELGFILYAKALLSRDKEDLEIITKKISKAEANCLKSFAEGQILRNSEASIITFREDVLSAVKKVLEKT